MVFAIAGIDTSNLGSMAVVASDQIILYGSLLLGIIVFGILAWFLFEYFTYNISVEILRQIGKPFIDSEGKKKILVNTEHKSGKLYRKAQKSGGAIEYFKIKGTDWNYKNYFSDDAFNPRTPGLFDFKKKIIRLFVDSERGLIPIYMSNPGFEVENVTLNEAIGAISDSLHERDNLYQSDFWAKYGNAITIAMLITFLVLGMIFVLKYQEVQWDRSMKAMESLFTAIRNQAAPVIEGVAQ